MVRGALSISNDRATAEKIMQGKVCVITGASSGIGLSIAAGIGRLGAKLILIGRAPLRCTAAMEYLKDRIPAIDIDFRVADLSILSEMHRIGDEIAREEPKVHVLINNAGVLTPDRQVTDDGLELMFAVNHLSHFVITDRLKHSLAAAGPARVLNVASEAHRGYRLDFDDLQSAQHFDGRVAYGKTKLANILFTRELASRVITTGVSANALHPGRIISRPGYDAKAFTGQTVGHDDIVIDATTTQGAETALYLATEPSLADTTGVYFEHCREVPPSAEAEDDAAAARLWDESAYIAGIER